MSQFFVVRKKRKGLQKKPLFVLIAKASIKGAAKRNQTRRRVKAVVAPLLPGLHSDVSVVVKKGADVLSFENLKRELLRAIEEN